MDILITGAGGQLGREWVDYLEGRSHNIYAFGSNRLDITKPKQIEEVFDEYSPDLVINCAAYTNVDKAEDEPEKAFLINEGGVKNLASACKERRIKLVHFSTDYVFSGSEKDARTFPDGYPEDGPINPLNVYGKSKRAGEIALENSGADWLTIRVSWLCGRYGGNFVKTMLRFAESRSELDIVKDQIGSPTFCFDVAAKTMSLIDREMSGYFHISSKGKISWYDFADKIFEITGHKIHLNPVLSSEFKTKSDRPAFSLLSTAKIESAGLKPLVWDDGLEQLIQQLPGNYAD